jgi:hypothetical protein
MTYVLKIDFVWEDSGGRSDGGLAGTATAEGGGGHVRGTGAQGGGGVTFGVPVLGTGRPTAAKCQGRTENEG